MQQLLHPLPYEVPFSVSVLLPSSCVRSYVHYGDCSATCDPSIDTFKVEYLVGPCAALALIFNYKFEVSEILWAFSIYLEAVAIFPQLFLMQRTGEAETITTHYLAALGIYRLLYIPNWIYKSVAVLFFDVVGH